MDLKTALPLLVPVVLLIVEYLLPKTNKVHANSVVQGVVNVLTGSKKG